MADRLSLDDLRREFDTQVSDLRKEINTLAKAMSEHGSDTWGRTRSAMFEAADRTGDTLREARAQAQRVSHAARENPKTAATLLSSAGVVSFLLGFALANALRSEDRRF
ncbi:hypothetical protein J8I29_24855 [Labrys sp. LIt4]|uniref:DUF883 domain-containing protein n=1 Tax=Labrys okinawensis TaxID=346911 RepID=A0A2S9QIA7_9HYPH|nr:MULTISPECIES: hypothetical protein [Labrys]MBP0582581.1 hypothetical protein [Labrys sp. LIt4]PRH89052.1 hypothetical protein C5L14_00185 [Labrys okinawensis]